MNINQENYEQFALDYLEGNLSDEDRAAFDVFLLLHPDIQATLANFELVTLESDPGLIFPHKSRLLRNEGGNIIFFRRKWIAVAASILLLLSIGYYFISNQPNVSNINMVQAPNDVSIPENNSNLENTSEKLASDQLERSNDVAVLNDEVERSRSIAHPNNLTEKVKLPSIDEHISSKADVAQSESKESFRHLEDQEDKTEHVTNLKSSEQLAEHLVNQNALPVEKLTRSENRQVKPISILASQEPNFLPEKKYAVHVTNYPTIIQPDQMNAPSKFKKFLAKANLIPHDLASADYDSFKRKLLPESIPGLK